MKNAKKLVLAVIIMGLTIVWTNMSIACTGQTQEGEFSNCPQSDKILKGMDGSGVLPEQHHSDTDTGKIQQGNDQFEQARSGNDPCLSQKKCGAWQRSRKKVKNKIEQFAANTSIQNTTSDKSDVVSAQGTPVNPESDRAVEVSKPEQSDENRALPIEEPIEIGILYFKTAKKPVPVEDFAPYWEEYRRAKDEFERADILPTLIPKIEKMKAHVDAYKLFRVSHVTALGKYNMDTGKFAITGLEDFALEAGRLYVKGDGFAIAFKNLREFKEFDIDKDTAKEIADKLGPSRKVRLIFIFEPKSVYSDAYPHGGFGFLSALIKTRYRVIGSRLLTLRLENPADGEMLYEIEAKPEKLVKKTAYYAKHTRKTRN